MVAVAGATDVVGGDAMIFAEASAVEVSVAAFLRTRGGASVGLTSSPQPTATRVRASSIRICRPASNRNLL